MNILLSLPPVLVLFAVATTAAFARDPASSGSQWRWTAQAAALMQAESGLDGGGDLSLHRFFVEGGGSAQLRGGWRVGLTLGYGEDDYDFSGRGFGGLDPWNNIRELRFSAPVQYRLNESWTLYGIPSLRFNAETGASLSDGKNGGVLAGASYRFSDRLTIGPGLGVFSEIEDDTSVFPVLIIDWMITDTLSLETGRGFAASRGPGLQLRWTQSPQWQFTVGGRYEKVRFRLDDDGIAADGVGEDTAIPLFVTAEYAVSPNARITAFGGVEVDGNVRLEDANGTRIIDSDISDAPFLGVSMQASF
jgi:outer membrane receptor protein involved in Fe transport